MRGRIGSGKSYRARALCSKSGAVLLSVDEAMETLYGKECLGREKHVKAESGVLSYFLSLVEQLHVKGIDAVLDHGFWTAAELKAATDYLEQRGIPYTVETVEADFETRLSRVHSRTDGKPFTREKLLKLDDYYEDIQDEIKKG